MSKTPVLNSTKTNSHNRSNHNNSTALVHTHPPSPSPSPSSLNQITAAAAAAATTSINPYPVLKVLPEEQFVSAIDHIVERDFFPHLAALKKIEQNDPTISSPNILAYTDTHTTRRGPRHDTHNMVTVTSHHAGINTPDSTTSNIHGNPLDPSFSATIESLDTENLSLNQFLDSFTTQDNSSFAKLVEKSSAERKRKYFWLYGDGTSSTNTQGLLESPHTQKSISDNSNNTTLITRDNPDNSKVITASPSNQSLNTWNFKARNALMYPPDTLDSQFSINPRAKTTSIIHKNTRFPKDFKSAPSNEKLVSMAQEIDGSATPIIRGYKLIDESPEHDTDTLQSKASKKSDQFVDAPRLKGRSYNVPDTPARDLLAHRLASKHQKSKYNTTPLHQDSNQLGSPYTPMSPHLRLLSPAGRNLLSNASKKNRSGKSKLTERSFF